MKNYLILLDMKKINLILLFLIISSSLFAQKDTVLQTIEVKAKQQITEIQRLSDVHGMYLTAGKKSESIQVADINANVAEKTPRQIFAKVPGVFVYDMDGSGNQVNIATRGLDPHRSWEYNVRQNGIMINSDIYGYPASHYSPPMEAIKKIEMIHGTGSLQYGAQFGGMINYITKQGDTTRPLSIESLQSVGSYGLLSSFNSIGGKNGKWSYYAYYQKRVSNGYRKDARSDAEAQFAAVTFQPTPSVSIHAEIGRNCYIYRIPGPLTDSMFQANPRQATRSRNYFNPDIYVPSIHLQWQISSNTKFYMAQSAILGNRNSVQFLGFADKVDKIEAATGTYSSRQVDIDQFHSYTTEARLSQEYFIQNMKSTLIGGFMLNLNDLHRRQIGKGTTATDFDLTLIDPTWGRDLHFKTKNIALFVENLLYITPQFSVSPGIRIEKGITEMTGTISYLKPDNVPLSIKHRFPLLGISTQYQLNKTHRLYGGWSQAYRPMIFADVIPTSILEKTDPNLKDANGYNLEMGINGKFKDFLTYDITAFRILYNNRIGSLILTDVNNQSYVYKTNTGNSITNGLEIYVETKPLSIERGSTLNLSFFTATSYFDAFYKKGSMVVNGKTENMEGKRLETVPRWISRNGLHFGKSRFSATMQYSFTDESYSDALNTVKPSANGAKGLVPSYGLWDFNAAYRLNSLFSFRCGINNIMDKQYFTKRPTGYPGQGVWSSDGRSLTATVTFRI